MDTPCWHTDNAALYTPVRARPVILYMWPSNPEGGTFLGVPAPLVDKQWAGRGLE